jgi:hypothetical protein
MQEAPNAIHTCDNQFFDYWWEGSAYLLGYLEADGQIKIDGPAVRVYFQTSVKDLKFLESLKRMVGWTGKTSISDNWAAGKKYGKARFTVSSRRWKDSLVLQQLRTDRLPEVPEGLLHHYIRGYFDGDGSIYRSTQANAMHSSFVFGSYHLAKEFASHLRRITGARCTVHKKANSDQCWYLTLAREATKKLGTYMYRDSTFSMKRKEKLFKRRQKR